MAFACHVFMTLRKNTRNNQLMLAITFLGKHQFLIPAHLSLIAYFLFVQKHTWFSIRIASIGLSSLLLMLGMKHLFHRQRPLQPLLQPAQGLSFPSGHAMMSVTFYGLLMYIISRTVKNKPVKSAAIAMLVLLIVLIGYSRIYLRVHYITGLLWLLMAQNVLNRLEAYNKRKVTLQQMTFTFSHGQS
jgi:undecaprenyl-diphosphatase